MGSEMCIRDSSVATSAAATSSAANSASTSANFARNASASIIAAIKTKPRAVAMSCGGVTSRRNFWGDASRCYYLLESKLLRDLS